MSFTLGEYQDIFLEEADEQLQELNQNLLELEKNPDNIDIINDIFRAAHSLKSSAAFVGLNDLSNLAHKMENLLQGIRDKTLMITPEIVDVIFKCFDEINSVIDSIASGEKPTQDLTWIINEIQAVSSAAPQDFGSVVKSPAGGSVMENVESLLDDNERYEIVELLEQGQAAYEIKIVIDKSAQMKWVKAQLILSNLGRFGQIIKTIPSTEDLSDDDTNNLFLVIFATDKSRNDIESACNIDLIQSVDLRTIVKDEDDNIVFDKKFSLLRQAEEKSSVKETAEKTEEPEEEYEEEIVDESEEDRQEEAVPSKLEEKLEQDRKKTAVSKTVKVSIDKLDQLLNTVGELVISNSGFYRLYEDIRKMTSDKATANEFKNRMEGMSRIAKDLQTGIMKTRMVEIGQIFNRFNRLVRDLAKEFNKDIELIIKGEDTELDKKVIDAIGEPLLHLIRNAVDHGIEPADEREKLGKPKKARVTLNAYQGGNHIFVEVSDDGKGMDIETIRRKVLEKGLATPELLSNMDTGDIYNFIFLPGFSTAKKITDVSGRGVGMNVVKQIVSDLNGSVSIESEPGMGTRFMMTFPLTLAIIPAIMVRIREELYAIPLSDVIETIKISQSDMTTIEGHEVINLRGEILSLLRLNRFVGLESALEEGEKIPVVVVGFGNRKIGLLVDSLEGKLEIVIKSLEQNYRTVEGLAGASILGDGSICLILDIATMINKVITEQDKISTIQKQEVMSKIEDRAEKLAVEEVSESSLLTEQAVKAEPLADLVDEKTEVFEEKITRDIPAVEEAEKKFDTVTQERDEEFDIIELDEDEIMKESGPVEIIEEEKIKAETGEKLTGVGQTFASEKSGDVDPEVKKALDDFKSELKDNISQTLGTGEPGDHMEASLQLSREDLNELQMVANVGATVAAESLSKIVDKRIDLSIPLVALKPNEKIPEYIGEIDSTYIGVMLPMNGDVKGTILYILKDDVGFELIDLLYGTNSSETKTLNEDGESALQEITNIIGSSMINTMVEKTGLMIKPDVPLIVHDYMQSIIDSILVVQNVQNDYAVVMDTAFFLQDDKLLGNLLIFPEAESMKTLIEGLHSNVG